jgi:exodeoxyribonuclease VII large subunit
MQPENVKILTIGELTRALKGVVEDAFPSVWVTGEISGYKKHSSGHHYFTLRDAEAQLKSALWRTSVSRLRFDPKDGIEVIARGRLDIYPPRGEYTFIVEEMLPKGLGAKELALQQLKQKLLAQGYFDPHRKRSLPRFPKRLAVVTSPTGAAIRDILKILERRWPAVEVWVCPVRVQGEGAGQEIAAAIRLANRIRTPIDIMIVGRGGGGQEDLWAFNEECVAQAIFASRIPIVSAVGHEIDLTIADLVADRRAATPSEAAELTVPDRHELYQGLEETSYRLRSLLGRRLELAQDRLRDLANRRPFRFPLERIHFLDQQFDEWRERLDRSMKGRLSKNHQRLESMSSRLESLSPLNVLARGYSLTRKEADGTVVKDSQQVVPGERVVTLFQHGRIVSRIEEAGPP